LWWMLSSASSFKVVVGIPNSAFTFGPNNFVIRTISSVWQREISVALSFPKQLKQRYYIRNYYNNNNNNNMASAKMTVSDNSENNSNIKSSNNTVTKFSDVLFQCIEQNQIKYGSDDNKGFGRILDAGTGSHSLRWIASLLHNDDEPDGLHVSHYTAITADEKMRQTVVKEAKTLDILDKGDIIIGNWQDDDLLKEDELYDTILADYLIGAMDGFSPYIQDLIFERLARHLKPGGKLYIVGLNPIADKVAGDANIFCRITKLRDACILLAGHRCYREYPPHWVERHLERANMKLLDTSKYDILYSHNAIVRQLNVARSKLPLFPTKDLANEMAKAIDDLEKESKELIDNQKSKSSSSPNNKRLRLGFDYVITAEKSLVASP